MFKGTAAAATLFVALATTAQAAPLKVCTVDWPPYTVSEGRQVSGMHTDTINAVFQHL